MKRIAALIFVFLLVVLPILIADLATAEAESYTVPLPGTVSTAAEDASEPFKIDLTPIFQAVIALIAALITGKLIPWIKSKTDEKQFANLEAAARVAVFAAEQIYGAAEGDAKLNYAVEKLRENGFDLDVELLREAVESAVYDMNYEKRLDIRAEAREARRIAGADESTEGEDELTLPPVEDWPLEMLMDFCQSNSIPCEGCVTKRDYLRAFDKFFGTSVTATLVADAPEDPAKPEEQFPWADAPEADSEAPASENE